MMIVAKILDIRIGSGAEKMGVAISFYYLGQLFCFRSGGLTFESSM